MCLFLFFLLRDTSQAFSRGIFCFTYWSIKGTLCLFVFSLWRKMLDSLSTQNWHSVCTPRNPQIALPFMLMLWNFSEVVLALVYQLVCALDVQFIWRMFLRRVWSIMTVYWNKWLKTTTTAIDCASINPARKTLPVVELPQRWWSMMGVFVSVFECMRERRGRGRESERERERGGGGSEGSTHWADSHLRSLSIRCAFFSPGLVDVAHIEQMRRSGTKSLWERSIDFSLLPETQEVSDQLAHLLVVILSLLLFFFNYYYFVLSVSNATIFEYFQANSQDHEHLEEIFKMSKFVIFLYLFVTWLGEASNSDDVTLFFWQHVRARVCLQALITLTINGCASAKHYFLLF